MDQPETLDGMIEHRARHLTAYQDAAYAQRYRRIVDSVRAAESSAVPGSSSLSRAVAMNLAKLMAYKDEYEVARLFTNGDFRRRLNQEFEGDLRLSLHMAPPFLSRRNAAGEPVKRTFGPWIMPVLGLLARMKGLRGTRFDLFGRTEERRTERRLIEEYENTVRLLVDRLERDNHALAVEIASVPDMIRGFGHIKMQSFEIAGRRRAVLMERLANGQAMPVAAE